MNNILKIIIIIAIIPIIIYLGVTYFPEEEENYEPINNEKLKEKIGQMLIIGFRGTEIDENSYISKTINELNIGGIILFDKDNPSGEFPRNIINYDQTKKLIEDLNRYSSSPLFISIDAEGGQINRLKEVYGFKNIPSAKQMGKETIEETENQANILGQELKALGFNLDFAPDVDVNVNPENPIIGQLERSFSADPIKVYEHASSFIKGLHQNNIITAIKHFPGHGSSTTDSHLGLVDVTNTYKQNELIPYQKLIENGYSDMVMTAHIINTNIDSVYPATLSPLFIKNILRDELNFNGVVVSDDMQMGAIVDNYGYDEAIIKAINAGCDMLIISNNGKTYDEKAPSDAVDIILKAIERGEISSEQINDSYNRIQVLKEKYKIKKDD